MLVLGIDPGSRVAGYGLVETGEKEKNGALKAIAFGVIKPPPSDGLPKRLSHIFNAVDEIIEKYGPDEVAVEDVFFSKNARSALLLGQARAAAILPGLNADIPLWEYSATQVKKALVGNGHAQKNQVADMAARLLGMKEIPKPTDITDALAIAICHIHSAPMLRKIAGL
ncbi:MAG: crossover junction endodeoxyribonuclease RuvC [Nitrospinota bacterium]